MELHLLCTQEKLCTIRNAKQMLEHTNECENISAKYFVFSITINLNLLINY